LIAKQMSSRNLLGTTALSVTLTSRSSKSGAQVSLEKGMMLKWEMRRKTTIAMERSPRERMGPILEVP